MATQDELKNKVENVKPMGIKEMIQASVKELGKALPSHMNPERLVRIALTTLRTTPKLYECTPQSFLAALFQSAQLGLEPNVEGQAYIIPYGRNAQFQIGYKGYVELFYRHGSALSLSMEEICENDDCEWEYGTNAHIKHRPALKDRGEVIAYYAVARLKDGAYVFKVMSKDDCMEHGKKHSKAFNRSDSPWQKDPGAMCKKTVLLQIMKLIPKSIEIQKAIAMDETVKTKVDVDMFAIKDETDWTDAPPAIDVDPAAGAEKQPQGETSQADAPQDPDLITAAQITKVQILLKSIVDLGQKDIKAEIYKKYGIESSKALSLTEASGMIEELIQIEKDVAY